MTAVVAIYTCGLLTVALGTAPLSREVEQQ